MEEGMKFRISLVKGKWSKTKDYGNIDNCEYYVVDETDILKCSADKYGIFHEDCGKDCELYKMLGKKGGDGSGNFGHSGRPGEVGGSGGGGEGRFPPVWANGGGYVDQKEYRNYLVKEGSTPEAMKNIEDNLYTHSGSSEDMQKAADEKLASYWNDPNSVEGTTMRSMADLEEHAAMENNRHNISQASSRVDEVQKYSPDKITAANYEDASFTIGDSPRSDTYSSSFDMKLDEATGGLDAAKNQSLYRKTASGDSKRQILSYSQNGEGAVTNPITGGDQRIVPNSSIKLTELKSSGFRILSGYAQQRGRPGEAEVVLIRDSAKGMKGSESSGNFGHEGRPGVGVGGSGGGDGGAVNRDEEVKEWHENLSPKEQDIISSWMGEGYTDIQFAQMGHEDRRDKIADAKRFERVMDKGIVYEGQAYRGLNMNDSEFDKITNAKSMTLDTHQSATDNLDDCAKFAAGSNNSVVLSMRCNTAVNLSAISTEREVVIKKGTSYRALGKSSISLNVPETMVGFTRVPARTITATKIELEEIK